MGSTSERVGEDSATVTAKKSRSRVPLPRALRRVLDMGLVSPIQRPPRDGDGSMSPATPRNTPTAPTAPVAASDGFDAFYTANYPIVTRLAYSLCGSLTVAEELAQEAFVAAHGRWWRISNFDRPDLWVRRVVINRSISYRRKQASERRALRRVTVAGRPGESEPELADDEVWQALRTLSARQAEVLALVYVEDRPIAEVAAILRLGEETVRTHLKRGRAALAARLGERRDAS